MFLFDYSTKTLSLNENIIIETLEADDSAVFFMLVQIVETVLK